jgi:hypothetical protein
MTGMRPNFTLPDLESKLDALIEGTIHDFIARL